jgi:hypothetical protein
LKDIVFCASGMDADGLLIVLHEYYVAGRMNAA